MCLKVDRPKGWPPPDGGPREGGFRGGGRGFGGGGFGGSNRGRIQFSLTDTITFVDRVTIAPGLPDVDYLHGDAASSLGGTPRHQVQAQGGWYNNGFGARVSANWRSGTRVDSLTGNDLNSRRSRPSTCGCSPTSASSSSWWQRIPGCAGRRCAWKRPTSSISKPKVRDTAGGVPFNYQPDFLDPIGRTVMISIRKLFLPPPSFFRRQQQERQQQQQEPTR